MWKSYLKSCESYDYEGEPSNTNEEQFPKVFIDENLLPKEHEEFEDDLHVEDQGTVLIFFVCEDSKKPWENHHKLW